MFFFFWWQKGLWNVFMARTVRGTSYSVVLSHFKKFFFPSFFCLTGSLSVFLFTCSFCLGFVLLPFLWTRQDLWINHKWFNSWPSLYSVTWGSIGEGQWHCGGTDCSEGETRRAMSRWSISSVWHVAWWGGEPVLAQSWFCPGLRRDRQLPSPQLDFKVLFVIPVLCRWCPIFKDL